MNKGEIKKLYRIANDIRITSLKMIYGAGSGHIGGSLSLADIITVLYFKEMTYDPKNPKWEDRDRLVLSKGHSCPPVYAALAMQGFFDSNELMSFYRIDSILQGHPDMTKTPGIDMSSGSLGQGLSVGVGMALAARLGKKNYRTYVILGDGECQEGQVWEAAMAASHFRLSNLTAIVDYNGVQLLGKVDEIMPLEPFEAKWMSFGWNTVDIDGHDIEQIANTIAETKKTRDTPTVIIAKTLKGKGVSFMEGNHEWHSMAPNKEEFERALAELESKIGE